MYYTYKELGFIQVPLDIGEKLLNVLTIFSDLDESDNILGKFIKKSNLKPVNRWKVFMKN